ncbi:UDP-N-acetylmuramoyl-L-alanine--D-glutamate ligase [Algivirga pacifica]|uniref:UDP-N-acetylmuramoylalanine--D-glutamate ligase n=1 Tax=Algivirga pacifica TaxID=1162670 RepID=A0ABP9D0D7_9BACT
MEKVAILGAGESGTGAALLAKSKGFQVFLSDRGTIAPAYKQTLTTNGIVFEEGKHTKEDILDAQLVIKSPGIPDTVPLLQEIYGKEIPVISEIEFAARYTDAKIIAITGTNGKTTTSLLTYHLLKENGVNVGLAGNIGDSFAKSVLEKAYDWYVLEVSSFQLDNIQDFKPHIGLILNITPDHLDRYQNDMMLYAASKYGMTRNMGTEDTFIYNENDALTLSLLKKNPLTTTSLSFATKDYDGEALYIDEEVYTELPLRGPHNGMNMSAAIRAVLTTGEVSVVQVKEALRSFKNTEHRLEEVGKKSKVLFINDSKATNVEASLYALQSFQQPIIWIAGGVDKGNDYGQMEETVKQHVKAIICLGKENEKIKNAFQSIIPDISETEDIRIAVQLAIEKAGGQEVVVLLSPACASFDLFRNYEDRGQQFKEAVQAIL